MKGGCDFLCFLGVAGFHFFSVAFAVESDYFYREVFELAVGDERAVEYVITWVMILKLKRVFTVRRGAFDLRCNNWES